MTRPLNFFTLCLILFGLSAFQVGDKPIKNPVDDRIAGLNVGNKVPNIVLKSPDGKEIELYDLKGKYVLIDFWASWCKPCRAENPNVVGAYHKYKKAKFKNGKGFTVYSVSLDKTADPWKRAITQDKLEWPYHVSDLKGWNSSAAAEFKVNSIPQSYLIGPDQTILAKNLRGQALHEALDEYVKKF